MKITEKIRKFHAICIKMKKLKKLNVDKNKLSENKFTAETVKIIPQIKSKIISDKKNKKEICSKEISKYFAENLSKCEYYINWRKKYLL